MRQNDAHGAQNGVQSEEDSCLKLWVSDSIISAVVQIYLKLFSLFNDGKMNKVADGTGKDADKMGKEADKTLNLGPEEDIGNVFGSVIYVRIFDRIMILDH